ncbi:MAG: DegV family protein [Bacteroidales bacterium]|jgi:DegV family protein with EDD domain|nr:DegV family protein [Bacteroidales bacterium]
MGLSENINRLTGKNLYYIFLAGAHKIIEHQKELNDINVFPVPDADTGSNLASTIRSIIEKISPDKSYKETADSIASAALDGARGNSGVIFAQFLYGTSNETCDCVEMNIEKFAQSVKNAVDYVYEAIAEPVEGTMLTVIREWAEHIYLSKEKVKDFQELLIESYQVAKKSLSETTQKLKILAKSNVVDAGAKGFVLFLEGIMELIKTKDIRKLIVSQQDAIELNFDDSISHETLTYRYCTEALIKSEKINKSELRNVIKPYGDSLVIAGSEKMVRIHIHTDRPQDLFNAVKDFGVMTYQKADDMYRQYEVAHHRKHKIALVTDTSCDLSPDLIDEHQIHFIPINIFIGENHYLDKVTMHPEHFYDLVDQHKEFAKTAQPNEKAFENLYAYLASHYDSIIAVHLTSKFSGTYNNSVKSAEKISKEFNKKITVIDSRNLSGALGLIILRIAREIEKGTPHDTILQQIDPWINQSKILVSVKNLKYMVRGGRVSPMKEKLASLMNVKPIVSMNPDGTSTLFDKAFSQKGNMKKVIRHIENQLQEKKLWNYIVLHANNLEGAKWYIDKMKALTGKDPVSVVNISPVIGLSAGRGAVSVAYMTG